MADEKNIRVKLLADDKRLERGLNQAKSKLQSFGNSINRIGKLLAGAVIVRQIIKMGAEAANLDGKMQGVAKAFDRLNDPTLLDRLKQATRGTVNELELMQKAVMADNFRIPMETLEKGLRFATQRAKETGLEVDYLVNSFVTGIGRKSQLVMDNLGISVLELQEEIQKTGDFATAVGNIMDRQMGDAADAIETSKDKTMRLNAAFKDFATTLGKDVNPTLDKVKDKLIEVFETISTSPAAQEAKKFLEDFQKHTLEQTEDKIGAISNELKYWEERWQALNEELYAFNQARRGMFISKEEREQRRHMEFQLEMIQEIIKGLNQYARAQTEVTDAAKETLAWFKSLSSQEQDLIVKRGITFEQFKKLHEAYAKQNELMEFQTDLINKETAALFENAKVREQVNKKIKDWSHLYEGEEYYDAEMEKTIDEYIKSQQEKARQLQMVNTAIADSFVDMYAAIGEGIGSAAIGGMESVFNNILRTVADFAVKFGRLVLSLGITREAISKIGLTGAPAIAAGTALVAIGSAIKGLLSSAGSMNLSGGGGAPMPTSGGGGVFSINVVGFLEGSTIRLANQRATEQHNMIT